MSLPKVEDAFEVWVSREEARFGRVAIKPMWDWLSKAFLAGAEYGAAAGEQMLCDRPYGHEGECASDRPGESAKGGRADSPVECGQRWNFSGIGCRFEAGHKGGHSWEPPECGIRGCVFAFGHRGECSPDLQPPTSPVGDRSPVCAVISVPGGLPCTFARHHASAHSWAMSRDYKVSATGAKSIPSLEAGTWDNTRSNPDMAHSAEGFAPPCVTSDTVVLTDKGWSAVKNICKPPLGVVPQHIWREARARDLARAIHEYCESGARIQRPSVPPATASPSNVYPVGDWIRELGELWETL